MSGETLLHGKGFATVGMLAHERATFLMEGENVALKVEHCGVGTFTAFSWTSIDNCFWGMSFHMLLKIVFAFKCFLAHFTDYFLFMGFSHMFHKLCPRFCYKGTSFSTCITFMHLPVAFQTAGGGKVFPTSFLGTPEYWFIGMLALVDFQLLMFLKGLFTSFKTTYILFLLIFMLTFNMFLQV